MMTEVKRPTFSQTVDVLVKAYLDDTLQHGYCSACAVGNLVAHALGTKSQKRSNHFKNGVPAEWDRVFCTSYDWTVKKMVQTVDPFHYNGHAQRQIDATGYTWEELAAIEYAFESVRKKHMIFGDWKFIRPADDQEMFDGLMAVVDVLADIHGVDLSVREEAKALFVKA